ncbi:CvpA family protein [Streptococcus sp. zg-JUN1979]|uniref:CvpA family protein n=1 Tax=Streptococcus sp. zg-JUN1979 TaxID=3391450 RepID=UPI0039A5190D
MLTLVILLILSWSFYIGYRRGIVLQGFYTGIAALAFYIASHSFSSLSSQLTLWVPYASPTQESSVAFFQTVALFDLNQVYYSGVAFLVIYTFMYVCGRFLGIFLHLTPISHLENRSLSLVSGVLSVFVTMLSLSIVFAILATIPLTSLQQYLANSSMARFLINSLASVFTGSWQ